MGNTSTRLIPNPDAEEPEWAIIQPIDFYLPDEELDGWHAIDDFPETADMGASTSFPSKALVEHRLAGEGADSSSKRMVLTDAQIKKMQQLVEATWRNLHDFSSNLAQLLASPRGEREESRGSGAGGTTSSVGVGDAVVISPPRELAEDPWPFVGRTLVVLIQKYPRALVFGWDGEKVRIEWRQVRAGSPPDFESLLVRAEASKIMGRTIEPLKEGKNFEIQDEATALEEARAAYLAEQRKAEGDSPGTAAAAGEEEDQHLSGGGPTSEEFSMLGCVGTLWVLQLPWYRRYLGSS